MANNMELANQYIVFALGDERYGFNIKDVTIIEKMTNITRVPGVPKYIHGVINLRGIIIPIVDIREKLNIKSDFEYENSKIVFLKLDNIEIGMIIDFVTEVYTFKEEDIEKVEFNNEKDVHIASNGVAKSPEGMVTLLNIESIIKAVEKEIIEYGGKVNE